MNLTVPNGIQKGDPITAAFLSDLCRAVKAITPQSSADILVSTTSGGTTFRQTYRPGSNSQAGTATVAPFTVYQHAAATPAPTTDWRTVRVKLGYVGQQYAVAAADCDNEPHDFVLDADSEYLAYVEVPINSGGGSAGITPTVKLGKVVASVDPHVPDRAHCRTRYYDLARITVGETEEDGLTIVQEWTGNITDTFLALTLARVYCEPADGPYIFRLYSGLVDLITVTAVTGLDGEDGLKCWLDLTVNSSGVVTAAAFDTDAADWPTQGDGTGGAPPDHVYVPVAEVAVESSELAVIQLMAGNRRTALYVYDLVCTDGTFIAHRRMLVEAA